MVYAVTNGVKVAVEVYFHPTHSRPIHGLYIFIYEIAIENCSPHTVQLLRRHWYIHDAYLQKREVEGEGVVGQQPILEPGETYKYFSSCQLASEIGRMYGTYQMQRFPDKLLFDIEIPVFHLMYPALLN